MTDAERTWLDNLRAGDKAIIASVYQTGKEVNVLRTTKSQIVVKAIDHHFATKYWRNTGKIVGSKSGWLVQP